MSKTDRFPKLVPQSELDSQFDRSVADLVIGAVLGNLRGVLRRFARPEKPVRQTGVFRPAELSF